MRDITLAETIYILFTTRAFATGIPTVLAGSPVVSAYENEGLTQITAGITLGVDHDGVVGLNLLTIVATGANGYEAGKDYGLVITVGTVGGVSVVGEAVGEFTIGRSAAATDLANGTDGLGAIKAETALIVEDTGTTIPALLPAALVGGRIDANVGAVSGDAGAADNLEAMYDGTGYVDPTGPAARAQVDGLTGASGGSVNIQATEDNTGGAIIDGVTFVGSVQGATTFANTEAEDGVLHDIDDVGDDIDIVYGFAVGGGRVATGVIFAGFVQGNSDEMKIKAYDHVGADWEIIGTIPGQNSTGNVAIEVPLLLKHTGTGAELGNVYIRIETDSTTPSNLSVDLLLVSAVSIGQSVGYAAGAVWIDTASGVAGVEPFVNGVADNPVDLLASAKTLAASVGLSDFHVINGSSLTLAEGTVNESYFGDHWSLDLGSQVCSGIHVEGASVTGIGTAASEMEFARCDIGTVSVQLAHFHGCTFDGTVTITATGDYHVVNGQSGVAGSGVPVFDLGAAIGATTLEFRRWSGGVSLLNVKAGDVVSIDMVSGGTVTVNGTGGSVNIRGIFEGVTDDSGGSVTIVQTAGINMPKINTEADTALSDYAGPTKAEMDSAHGLLATAANLILVDTVVDAIKAVTDLLPDGGALSDLATILADTNELQGDDVPGLIAALNNLSAAAVNAEMVDALSVDTYAEPGQETPAATASLATKLGYLFKGQRNRSTQTDSEYALYNDDAVTVDQKATFSDDTVTADRGELESGP